MQKLSVHINKTGIIWKTVFGDCGKRERIGTEPAGKTSSLEAVRNSIWANLDSKLKGLFGEMGDYKI